MEKPSWICTVVTQLSLLLSLFLAFNLGQLHDSLFSQSKSGGRPLDLYFISVTGGFRSLKQQTHLLKQMEKVVRTYKARFIVDISEHGEDDPLMQNGTWHFSSLNVPWFTTGASDGQGTGCFIRKIKMHYGNTLDIVGIDTPSLRDPSIDSKINQLQWLTRTLEATDSIWSIVVGFHPLANCGEKKEQIGAERCFEPLHQIFLEFGVNAYLSQHGCTSYALERGIAYIGTPGPTVKEPYLINGRDLIGDGFLLHKVSSLEIVTYFVDSIGEFVSRITLQQRGKEIM